MLLLLLMGGSSIINIEDEDKLEGIEDEDKLEGIEDELVDDLLDNNSPLEDLLSTGKDGFNNHLGEFIGCLPGGISRTMQEFADEEVNRGFKNRVIETLSGTDGVYSEDSFKRALSLEGKEELASLSPGDFVQRVDSFAQRILRPDEYTDFTRSTITTRYEELNRLLKEKNDRALEALGNAVNQISEIPPEVGQLVNLQVHI